MRKIIIVTVLLVVASFIFLERVGAQNPRFIASMERYVRMLDTATTTVTLWQAANGFERIARAAPAEWLPNYWAAYSFVLMTILANDKDQVDLYCDKAEGFIHKADSISPNNSEVYTMMGFIDAMRIQVNPMMRGRVYGPKSAEKYEKAMKLDENNPRPYALRGEGIMNTPVMFGGGAGKACPYLEKAVQKFDKFQPANSIMPNWGGSRARKLHEENCK